ncbi:MAG: hypothetical protein CL693_01960 [Cellvibrionaceae bacterium]|nr:hypothetical protein [Cellvibrionaceae bacterium]
MQKVYYYWLICVGVGHAILGCVFVLLAFTPLMAPYMGALYEAFQVEPAAGVDLMLRTTLQFLGPTIASWGLLFALAVHFYRHHGYPLIKWYILIAVFIWFTMDTALSLSQGIYVHLIANLVALCAILPPLLLLRPNSVQ